MRRIYIELEVPWSPSGVRCALAAVTTVNRILMRDARRKGMQVPRLYKSGVRYHRQPPERFLTWPTVLSRGVGDCDQLCAWRAAELQERGIRAVAVPLQRRRDLMHVVVRYPSGRIEDPSRILGMR